MATNWTYSGASAIGSGVSSAVVAVIPPVGSLMVVSGRCVETISVSSIGISDTGSGGWQAIDGAISAKMICQGWWKIATSADYNGGSGINVTVTQTGGVGTAVHEAECDIFTVPAGYGILGLDTYGYAVGGTVSTLSATGSVGSSYSSSTDALAWTLLAMPTSNTNGGRTSTNTFTGTSAAANLANCVTTANTLLLNQYVGGVQASATAATNVWVNTWTNARTGPVVVGAVFQLSPPVAVTGTAVGAAVVLPAPAITIVNSVAVSESALAATSVLPAPSVFGAPLVRYRCPLSARPLRCLLRRSRYRGPSQSHNQR